MKLKIIWLPFIVFLASCATASIENQGPKDKFNHWFEEEASLLLLPEEKEEFSKLKAEEEKERFIEKFWARRDPDPWTEKNEFKEEWYERLEFVTRTFTRGIKKGWRSDLGRVYLFFGKPWRTHITPPTVREVPYGGHQQEYGRQIWVYKPKPELGLISYFNVVFIEYQYGFDLEETTSQIIRRALEIYPRTVIRKPDK